MPWKHCFVSLSALFVLTCLVGCSRSPAEDEEANRPKTQADLIMEQQIEAANQLAEALESRAPDDEIAALQANFEEAGEAWQESGLSDAAIDEATARYQEEFDKAIRRWTKASMKSGTEAL